MFHVRKLEIEEFKYMKKFKNFEPRGLIIYSYANWDMKKLVSMVYEMLKHRKYRVQNL